MGVTESVIGGVCVIVGVVVNGGVPVLLTLLVPDPVPTAVFDVEGLPVGTEDLV